MHGLVLKVLAAFAFTAVLLARQAHASPRLGPGHEPYFRSLVPEAVLSRCAWRLEGIQIEGHEARYLFSDDSTQRKATIALGPVEECDHPARGETASFCVSTVSAEPTEPDSLCGPRELERGIRNAIASKPSSFRWKAPGRPRDPTVEDLRVSQGAMAAVLWLWLALTAIGGGMLAASLPKMDARRDLAVLAVTLSGLLLRMVATPFPANIRLGYGEPHGATAGREAFHLLLRAFGPLTLENVAAANAVLGALTIPAAAVLGRMLFRSNLAAVAGASVLAFHPILIRFSASDSAHVVVTLCTVLALVCTVAGTTRGSLLWYAQAVGWIALAAATRHEAALFLVACIALAVTAREHQRRTSFRRLIPIALLAIVLLCYPVLQVARLAAHTDVFNTRVWSNPFFFAGPSPWPNEHDGLPRVFSTLRTRAWRCRRGFPLRRGESIDGWIHSAFSRDKSLRRARSTMRLRPASPGTAPRRLTRKWPTSTSYRSAAGCGSGSCSKASWRPTSRRDRSCTSST